MLHPLLGLARELLLHTSSLALLRLPRLRRVSRSFLAPYVPSSSSPSHSSFQCYQTCFSSSFRFAPPVRTSHSTLLANHHYHPNSYLRHSSVRNPIALSLTWIHQVSLPTAPPLRGPPISYLGPKPRHLL
ncbi:hypothetical protein PHAVU_004G073425 [Phaseolus vulgaris]